MDSCVWGSPAKVIADDVVRINMGAVSIYPMIGGSFDSEDDTYREPRNSLYVGATLSQEIRDAVSGIVPTNLGAESANGTVKITSVMDLASEEYHLIDGLKEFRIAGIDSPFTHDYPYESIYAQAYHLWQTGFRYWLDEADDAELALHHRQFEELTIEEELIYTYLRVPGENETGEFLTTTRIIELIGHSIRTPLDKRKVGRAMARMEFTGKKTMKANGWNVIVLMGDDIKNRQRLDALNSSNDDSQ